MDKMSKYIIICLTLCICLCGCDNNKNNTQNNESINTSKEEFFELENLSGISKKDVVCEEIKDIIDFSFYDNLFITKDGKLYEISFNKIFTNNKNCKQVESGNIFVKFIKGGILDNENNIYYYNSDKQLEKFDFHVGYPTMPYLVGINQEDYINISAAIVSTKEHYFYTKNNKVYLYKDLILDDKTLIEEPIFTFDNDETIEYSIDGTIKTNKKIYIFSSKITNEKECQKYADVDCIYKDNFYELDNTELSKQYENIYFYKSSGERISKYNLIIDKSYNIYLEESW